MTYDEKNKTVTIECSGRQLTSVYGGPSLSVGTYGELLTGYDNDENASMWAQEERAEVAQAMIQRWTEWMR